MIEDSKMGRITMTDEQVAALVFRAANERFVGDLPEFVTWFKGVYQDIFKGAKEHLEQQARPEGTVVHFSIETSEGVPMLWTLHEDGTLWFAPAYCTDRERIWERVPTETQDPEEPHED